MKMTRYTTLSIALGLLVAATAMAQEQVQMIVPTSYNYDEYYTAQQASPNVAAEKAPATPAATDAAPCNQACESCSQCEEKPCRWCRCGKLADPWTLPQPNALKQHDITVGGWLEGGFYGNQYGTPSNGPIGLRNVGDGFTADQLWIFAERKTDTKGCGWDLGGRVDYLFGADGPDTQAFGNRTWDYGWNSSRDDGSAIPQLYGEVAYNDLKVKMGHFYTPIGYEVVQAPGNFFYSHSYSHTFGQPFTHTGALASYQPNEKVTYYGGWVNGWDYGFNSRGDGSMFLGGLSFNLSEKATLAWYLTAGKFGNGVDSFSGVGPVSGDLYYNCVVFTYKLSEKLTYIFEHDLGTNYNVDPTTNSVDRLPVRWRTARVVPGSAGHARGCRRSRRLLRHDHRLQLEAARQRHDSAGIALRRVQRHRAG
jgi:hypothetical protein